MLERSIKWMLATAVAAALCITFESTVFAYPPPQGTAQLVSGCSTLAAGGSCDYTFKFTDANGDPVAGLAVGFSDKGLKGCSVVPGKSITDSTGTVTTTLSCSAKAGTGTDTVTAKSGKVSADARVSVGPSVVATGARVPLRPADASFTLAGEALVGLLLLAAASALMLGGKILLRNRRAVAK